MARMTVVICTDDLTGQEHPESEVHDVSLRFGYDEWTLTLTDESQAKIKEMFASIVENTPHKDHTPKWIRDQEARDQEATGASQPSDDQRTVTLVPPDNKMVRRWWRELTATQRKALNLKEPPAVDRGKIPDDVVAAFAAAHAAPAPQFTG